MMRQAALYMMAAVLLLLLSGCGNSPKKELRKTPYTGEMTDPGMYVQTAEGSYRKGDTIYCFVENRSGAFGNYNHVLQLEHYEKDGWYRIEYLPNIAFTEPLFGLENGARASLSVSTALFDYNFPEGHYRVCMEWSPDFSASVRWEKVSFAEFDIVKKKAASADDLAAFVNKAAVNMPAKTTVVLSDSGAEAEIRFEVLNDGGTFYAVKQGKETNLFGFLCCSPDRKRLLLSNFLDPAEAIEKGYLFEEGIDFISLGPADEEIIGTVSSFTAKQKNNLTRISVKLDEKGREVFAAESVLQEDVLELACTTPGRGEVLSGLYDTEKYRLTGLRRLSDTAAEVYFETDPGDTVKKRLDIDKKTLEDIQE